MWIPNLRSMPAIHSRCPTGPNPVRPPTPPETPQHNVPPGIPSPFPEPGPDSEPIGAGLGLRVVVGQVREHADAPHALGLLRARDARPRESCPTDER